MNIGLCVIGMILAVGWSFLLKKSRIRKNAELTGGFAHFVGIHLKEAELLRVLVLEELANCLETGTILSLKKCRLKRIVITVTYIVVHSMLLMDAYHRTGRILLCIAITLLYIFSYYRIDDVEEICNAVKKQPYREISQIVREITTDQPKKSGKHLEIAAVVLSLVLVLAMNAKERYTFAPANGGYSVEDYHPSIFAATKHIRIPETNENKPVVAIGKHAFEGHDFITQVSIPDTVVLIDSYAFKDCSRLERVQLPAGLQTLNGESFRNCSSLTEIVIPDGVTEIRGNTFEGCSSLESVVLHEGIMDIHAYAFRNCSRLERIRLPSKITEIHAYAFENCVSLREIEIPMGVTRIAAHAFYNCSNLKYAFVPDSVLEIRSSAFRECDNLKEIELPEGVSIDEKAFKDSPTIIKKKKFTDEQLTQIIKAAEEKTVEILYYVYKKDNPEVIVEWQKDTILLVDDIKFAEMLNETDALQAINSDDEALVYLEAAKTAGCTEILRGIYSPMASEIAGEPIFMSASITIEDQIANCLTAMAEEGNE